MGWVKGSGTQAQGIGFSVYLGSQGNSLNRSGVYLGSHAGVHLRRSKSDKLLTKTLNPTP